jgi:hypothetical protein
VPAAGLLMMNNQQIGIRYASSSGERIKDLTINNLTKNLDLVILADEFVINY